MSKGGTAVSDSDIDVVRRIYGFDWASVSGRREGLGELAECIAPQFESRFTPELGNRITHGVEQLAVFGEALEQDFSEFRYLPASFEDAGAGAVLVTGRIACTARASGMPLGGEFSHFWRLREGLAVSVDAFRDEIQARAAAGS